MFARPRIALRELENRVLGVDHRCQSLVSASGRKVRLDRGRADRVPDIGLEGYERATAALAAWSRSFHRASIAREGAMEGEGMRDDENRKPTLTRLSL